jgi:hypothetical protein
MAVSSAFINSFPARLFYDNDMTPPVELPITPVEIRFYRIECSLQTSDRSQPPQINRPLHLRTIAPTISAIALPPNSDRAAWAEPASLSASSQMANWPRWRISTS